MIGEVQKALTAYDRLDSTGKRLFRDELGLVRPQQARPRRKRAAKAVDIIANAPTLRRARRTSDTTAPVQEPIGV